MLELPKNHRFDRDIETRAEIRNYYQRPLTVLAVQLPTVTIVQQISISHLSVVMSALGHTL
jgi:hypothetical protein